MPTYLSNAVFGTLSLVVIRILVSHFFPTLDIKRIVWELWIPMAYVGIATAIWLRPRLKILKPQKRGEDIQTFLVLVGFFSLVAPSMLAQGYVLQAIATLHGVETTLEIDTQQPHRYYLFEEYEIDTSLGGVHSHVYRSNRGSDATLTFYYAYPVVGPRQNFDTDHAVWYGLTFKRKVDKYGSEAKRKRQYETAYQHGLKMVEFHDFRDQQYFEVVQPSDERDYYRRATRARTGRDSADDVVILMPRQGDFQARTGNRLAWIFVSAAIGSGVILLCVLWLSLDNKELERQQRGVVPKAEFVGDMKVLLMPHGEYFIAPLLIIAISLVWIVVSFLGVHPINPTGGELLEWGANRRGEVLSGQWWRLATNMFLHGGLMHLLVNIMGLILAALFVEPMFGRVRFLVIYLLSGISGSLASIWWYENTASVGASGAIFGLYGAALSLGLFGVVKLGEMTLLLSFVGINLLYGLTPGIDNAAHIGGFLAGALIGAMLQVVARLRQKPIE